MPHVVPHDPEAGPSCKNDPVSQGIPCSELNTQGLTLTPYDLYMVVGQADSFGVAGLTIGIYYDGRNQSGVDVLGWQLCTTGLEFPSGDWPCPGSGNVMTWNTADRGLTEISPDGVHATAGVFYVYAYSSDIFFFTEHRQLPGANRPRLAFANCYGQEWEYEFAWEHLGFAQFGFGEGCNPCKWYCIVHGPLEPSPNTSCSDTPVEAITWGRIKGLYR